MRTIPQEDHCASRSVNGKNRRRGLYGRVDEGAVPDDGPD